MARITQIVEMRPDDPNLTALLAEAVRILHAGGTVAFPTETVYGLGADATSATAVAKIYAAKGRPAFNPLIAHVATLAAARLQGRFSPEAEQLAEAFWPGPLTLVLPLAASANVCGLARAGLESVALRIPHHPIAQALLSEAGRPIAAPSANRSGRISPVTAAHVFEDLNGEIDMILDGGPTKVGVESTIIACLGGEARLLRPGGISREDIEAILKRPLATPQTTSLIAPGMMASHYAPQARLRFSPGPAVLDLSPTRDLAEAAAHLFDFLHQLDRTGRPDIAVAPIPEHGLGAAINDRLRRAAAPRP
jgi:L-threonylcarbamoyladenylate synthase